MTCSNTQKEIDRDVQTNAQEQAQYEHEARYWKICVDLLLLGQTVNANGRQYSLAERMANEYQPFSDFVDQDYDFMAEFKAGKLCDAVTKLIQHEARTLASIIAG